MNTLHALSKCAGCLRSALVVVLSFSAAMILTSQTDALPPAPANDEPGSAEVLPGTVPILVYGSTVLGNDSISSTTLPSPADDSDGPDVFYRFTPDVTGTYRIQLLPWQRAPLRSSDRRFIVYVQDAGDAFLAGAEAPGTGRTVSFDVPLTMGQTYRIGVDHDGSTSGRDNFEFTLLVDIPEPVGPNNCGTAESLPQTTPIVVLQDIDGATDDFTFVQGTGRCEVPDTPTDSAIDHVYSFKPAVSGDYAIEVVSEGFNAIVWVTTACPFTLPGDCIGASNHSNSGGGKHELIVVSLVADTEYWIVVDGETDNNAGTYAMIVDDAINYEINEVEPNDTSATASLLSTPLNGGQLLGNNDEDWWAVPGSIGDRVYAWVNNGGSSNSTLDTDLGFYATDGTTLIEFDDEDADGADAPIQDLRFIYATSAPVIAGAQMTANGTHFFRVTDQSTNEVVHRYRFHTGVIAASRTPFAEVEPNDSLPAADSSGKNYFSGVIDTSDDVDFYAFEATIGDRIFIALDGDPERDATGSDTPANDPRATAARLVIYDSAGDILISDVSDSNSIQSAPDYPAQGGFFTARSNGTHFVEVQPQSTSSGFGPETTYELAVFTNSAAPILVEEDAPQAKIVQDFDNDHIDITVTDNMGTDTGICSVALVDNTNLQINNLTFTPGDPTASFDVTAVSGGMNGSAKLVVTDCAGNTTIEVISIDVTSPECVGTTFAARSRNYTGGPIHVPDNEPAGLETTIEVEDAGLITDVNVTMTIETFDPADLDIFLISPMGTEVELVTDRMSSLAVDMRDTTFDDSAEEILPILSSQAPYTGSWLPEDPDGLAQLTNEQAMGTWTLRVIDDSSSDDFGATLTAWSLDINATFAGPEQFAGNASEADGLDSGIDSITLMASSNVTLNLPVDFTPGDASVDYSVTLNDPTMNGSATVLVSDGQENTCTSVVSLTGAPDSSAPMNTGSVTKQLSYMQEVQAELPVSDLNGVESTITVAESFMVGEVEVAMTIDTTDQGRIAANLSHGGEFAAVINRIGMDDRGSVGNTKNGIDVILDDDAPAVDDIHLEPALGSVPLIGLHQPDGRGDFFGDGITTDPRDNMLFRLANQNSLGDWTMLVADTRPQGSSDAIFRRWSMTLKNSCGAERYVATAKDLAPGLGVCSISLMSGSNLDVIASFTPGDAVVEYRVELIDQSSAGAGMVEILDCAGNSELVAVALDAASPDNSPPVMIGSLDTKTQLFTGTATEIVANDTGIASVELAPFGDNLQIDLITPDPPNGATSVDFEISRVDINANGRGYVRVTDVCGHRSYLLVEFDGLKPDVATSRGRTMRYLSGDLPAAIPENDPLGVISSISVPDADVIFDVNLTFNIIHPFDDDIELALVSPVFIDLFSDIGSTGNDFIDTTLDDEAASPIPDSSSEAPFTDSYQPEGGPALFALDGTSAAATYSLRVVDDANNNEGTFESWSLTIESPTFALRHDGRAADNRALDAGVDTIELLPGSDNLVLNVDPFTRCDGIVRYSVELIDRLEAGMGTVRITDCVGNFVDDEVCLIPTDINDDCLVDTFDLLQILEDWGACESPTDSCLGDINGDGVVDVFDLLRLLEQWTGSGGALQDEGGRPNPGLKKSTTPDLVVQSRTAQPKEAVGPLESDQRILYINDDFVSPLDYDGAFVVAQDYLQTENGVLQIELAGRAPIAEYDMLVAPGRAKLDGVLAVVFGVDYEPRAGDRFVIVAAGTLAGAFAELELPHLPRGLEYDVSISQRSAVLTIVSAAAPTPTNVHNELAALIGDVDGDGVITVIDLQAIIDRWGDQDVFADLNADGVVDGLDLEVALLHWR